MNELELLGKSCKDIVTGFEGVCIGATEWMYGCRQYVLQSKSAEENQKGSICFFSADQLDVTGEGVTGRIAPPAYDEPRFFGRECVDKVTKVKGMCIGRVIWLFSANQYILEIQPEDMAKESRLLWLDEGRLEPSEQPKHEIDPADVASPRPGGVMDAAFYPSANCMIG